MLVPQAIRFILEIVSDEYTEKKLMMIHLRGRRL